MGTALQAPNLEETVPSMQQCVDHVQQPRFTVASLLRMRPNAEIRITIAGESIMESVSTSLLCHLHKWKLLMTWNLQTLATTGKFKISSTLQSLMNVKLSQQRICPALMTEQKTVAS